jgi:hypothetical protein
MVSLSSVLMGLASSSGGLARVVCLIMAFRESRNRPSTSFSLSIASSTVAGDALMPRTPSSWYPTRSRRTSMRLWAISTISIPSHPNCLNVETVRCTCSMHGEKVHIRTEEFRFRGEMNEAVCMVFVSRLFSSCVSSGFLGVGAGVCDLDDAIAALRTVVGIAFRVR